ncbi:cytochrome c-type biogenesis protein CcmH [Alphaproteobacteria bacterium]|nr:cytochrome c-type biogenesis protein CcmH [Alphaproteobacteria bacterium]
MKSFYRLLCLTFLLLPLNLFAEDQTRIDFYKTIRCLVCDGQSIYDSETVFAQNLREQIKLKFDEGFSKKNIKDQLSKIYGEDISFQPSSNDFFLWFIPFLILFLLLVFNFGRYAKKKKLDNRVSFFYFFKNFCH